MNKIKKGDQVVVLTGKDCGARGKVLQLFLKQQRVIVEGVNLVKKTVKANPRTNTAGKIIEREAAIHISNIAIYNPMTEAADRVGFKILADGKKVRCFKSNGEFIDLL